ncbi:MAG: DUF4097 family beta strand repeat-containing protein [Defluviitaleaceae bacterium]|nr:DUF4097 family beta strand repeat-containing protein [Defluviitaleaceae bacterium]
MKEERMKVLELLQDGKISADEAASLLQQFPEKEHVLPTSNDGGLFSWLKDSIFSPGGTKITLDMSSQPIGGNGISSLRLVGKNGSVSVSGCQGNCIKIKCQYIPKGDANPQIELYEENGFYELRYDNSAVKYMKISCDVPMIMIDNVYTQSSNGNLKFEDTHCTNIEGHTTNGKVSLENVKAHSAKLYTINGKISLDNVEIVHILAETTNGAIKVDKSNQIGPWAEDHVIEGGTTNGSISVVLPQNIGIKLDASTTNGRISCDIEDDTIHGEISRNHINGCNQKYENTEKRIDLKLSTTNGSIKVEEAHHG